MKVIKSGSRYEIWENGYQVYEYKTRAGADSWEHLRESDREQLRAIWAKRQAAKATGMKMRGGQQRRYAYKLATMGAES